MERKPCLTILFPVSFGEIFIGASFIALAVVFTILPLSEKYLNLGVYETVIPSYLLGVLSSVAGVLGVIGILWRKFKLVKIQLMINTFLALSACVLFFVSVYFAVKNGDNSLFKILAPLMIMMTYLLVLVIGWKYLKFEDYLIPVSNPSEIVYLQENDVQLEDTDDPENTIELMQLSESINNKESSAISESANNKETSTSDTSDSDNNKES